MKVGFVTPFFSPRAGGSAVAPYNLARQLVKTGHDVCIFTSDMYRSSSKFPDEKELRIYESKCTIDFGGFYYSPSIIRSIGEVAHGLDVLHLHNLRTYQNIAAYRVASATNLPYVIQAHGSIPRVEKTYAKWLFDRIYGSRLLSDASALVALSQVEVQQYLDMGVDSKKIVIIPNGIDTEEYMTEPAGGRFRAQFGIAEGVRMILYLGRIHKTKGIDFLMRAFARICLGRLDHPVVLVVAGPDDGYLVEARRLANSLRVSKALIFTGLLTEEQKRWALADADIVVYPSLHEPFGIVTIEAAAASKPVIVSKDTPMATTVEEGQFGITVEYGNVNELAERIAMVVGDVGIANMLGSNGRKFVFANFAWAKIAEAFERTYEMVTRN